MIGFEKSFDKLAKNLKNWGFQMLYVPMKQLIFENNFLSCEIKQKIIMVSI